MTSHLYTSTTDDTDCNTPRYATSVPEGDIHFMLHIVSNNVVNGPAHTRGTSTTCKMQFLQALAYADARKVILDFLCANEMVTVFCSCLSLRLPCGENVQDIKQCYLSWLNSSGVDARLLQILACPATRNAVTDFLYAHNLVLTYLSCRTLKLGFLDDIEDVKERWLRWWDAQRDEWVRTHEDRKTSPHRWQEP